MCDGAFTDREAGACRIDATEAVMAGRSMRDGDQLDALQEELAAAQKVEAAAMRALTGYTGSGRIDHKRFVALLGAAADARADTERVYKKWKGLRAACLEVRVKKANTRSRV
jgi:hypothetical protein